MQFAEWVYARRRFISFFLFFLHLSPSEAGRFERRDALRASESNHSSRAGRSFTKYYVRRRNETKKTIYLPVSRTILRAFNLDQVRVIEWSIPVRALCPSNQRNIPRSAKECENCLMFSYSAIKAMIRNWTFSHVSLRLFLRWPA